MLVLVTLPLPASSKASSQVPKVEECSCRYRVNHGGVHGKKNHRFEISTNEDGFVRTHNSHQVDKKEPYEES